MGLLTGIFTLPLAPLRGVAAVAEHILRQAEAEFYDPGVIRAQLDEVERLREAGELTEEEATAWEDALVDRLVEGQRIREGRA